MPPFEGTCLQKASICQSSLCSRPLHIKQLTFRAMLHGSSVRSTSQCLPNHLHLTYTAYTDAYTELTWKRNRSVIVKNICPRLTPQKTKTPKKHTNGFCMHTLIIMQLYSDNPNICIQEMIPGSGIIISISILFLNYLKQNISISRTCFQFLYID